MDGPDQKSAADADPSTVSASEIAIRDMTNADSQTLDCAAAPGDDEAQPEDRATQPDKKVTNTENGATQTKDVAAPSQSPSHEHAPNEKPLVNPTNDADGLVASEQSNQAAQIRRQVEFYFSDENLAHDKFLIAKIHGHKNMPMPLETICGFKRMRNFQPFSAVVEALKVSKVLEVVNVDGKECIVRKTPYLKHKQVAKPTGFEEYWTDPPITPAQHAEEQDLYNQDRSFAERIETALQRYRAKRRFSTPAANIYTKWMKYGGIDTGPKQFSGQLTQEALEENTASEIAALKATEYVGEDKYETGEAAKWNVDFEAVAKGFLSSAVPQWFNPRTEAEIKEFTNILRNFYNYILYHNVCPEHAASVHAARDVCQAADRELFATVRALELFPGAFNVACSTLFDGYYSGLYTGDQTWNKAGPAAEHIIGMSDRAARLVFAVALAAYGTEPTTETEKVAGAGPPAAKQKTIFGQKVVRTEEAVGFEVTSIEAAAEDVRELYEKNLDGRLATLGRLRCKPWAIPTFELGDLPAGFVPPERPAEYVFLMDKQVLTWCFVGMKIEASVHTLSGGLQFFDAIRGVYCSFYTVLENELLRGWKEPRMYTREEQLERNTKEVTGGVQDGDETEDD